MTTEIEHHNCIFFLLHVSMFNAVKLEKIDTSVICI